MRQARLKELHSQTFYRSTNTLIVSHLHRTHTHRHTVYTHHKAEGFLQLASMGGHGSLSTISCLLSATSCLPEATILHRESTYRQLQWSSLSTRSALLSLLQQTQQNESALRHCQQLSAIISHSGLESSPKLRALQMKVSSRNTIRVSHCVCRYSSLVWSSNQTAAGPSVTWGQGS